MTGLVIVSAWCSAAGHLPRCCPECILFALAVSRVLAPSGKLAAAGRVAGDVHIDGLSQLSDDAWYRAMDGCTPWKPASARPGTPVRCCPGMRTAAARRPAVRRLARPGSPAWAKARTPARTCRGIVGVAVARDGIPGPLLVTRCRRFPLEENPRPPAQMMRASAHSRMPSRAWPISAEPPVSPGQQRAGGACVLGGRLRPAAPGIQAELARQGRCRQVAGSMDVKEVRPGDAGGRMVICCNPGRRRPRRAVRGQLLTRLGAGDWRA